MIMAKDSEQIDNDVMCKYCGKPTRNRETTCRNCSEKFVLVCKLVAEGRKIKKKLGLKLERD